MSGPWFAVDAAFMDGPRERALWERWGWCGIVLWMAFTAACKRSQNEGRVAFHSEEQLAAELGVHGRPLEDRQGKPFTLQEFFAWTGIRRWTRMQRRTRPAVIHAGWEAHQRYRVYPRRAQPRHTPSQPMPNLARKRRSEGGSVDAALTNDVPDPGGTPLKGVPPPTGGGAPPEAHRESAASPAPSQGSGSAAEPGQDGNPAPVAAVVSLAVPADWRDALRVPRPVPVESDRYAGMTPEQEQAAKRARGEELRAAAWNGEPPMPPDVDQEGEYEQ